MDMNKCLAHIFKKLKYRKIAKIDSNIYNKLIYILLDKY